MKTKTISNRSRGILHLLGAVTIIWIMTFIVLPTLTGSFTCFQTLADFIDSSGIDTGQFYYTDVEIVTQADVGARSSIAFFQNKERQVESRQ
jgi:hypothetical protein